MKILSEIMSRILAGKRAQANGAGFESIFESACRFQGIACTEIPDGCRQLGHYRVIRVKTPWDFVVSLNGKTALIDTKTCLDNFANSQIDQNQVTKMMEHCRQRVIAGYVVWTRRTDSVFFLRAEYLYTLLGVRGSVAALDEKSTLLGSVSRFRVENIFRVNQVQ